MTRKDRLKALFKLAPGIEISGGDALEITGFWLSWWTLRELEREEYLASRWETLRPGREHRRRLYRLSQAAHVGEAR